MVIHVFQQSNQISKPQTKLMWSQKHCIIVKQLHLLVGVQSTSLPCQCRLGCILWIHRMLTAYFTLDLNMSCYFCNKIKWVQQFQWNKFNYHQDKAERLNGPKFWNGRIVCHAFLGHVWWFTEFFWFWNHLGCEKLRENTSFTSVQGNNRNINVSLKWVYQ